MARLTDLLAKVGAEAAPAAVRAAPRSVAQSHPQGSARADRAAVPAGGRSDSVVAFSERRLVVPAYGFDNPALAERYLATVSATIDETPRTVIRAAGRTYVERDLGMFETNMDLDPLAERRGAHDPRYRQPWPTIRRADQNMPDGAYHVLLLTEGRRETHWYGDRKRSVPWVNRARSGPWHVATSWERGDGQPLRPIFEKDGLRVYAAHSARGVLIARRAALDASGTATQFVTEVRLMSLDVFDRNTRDGDKVRPEFNVSRHIDDTATEPAEYRDRVPDVAKPAFDRAAAIFREQCSLGIPAEVEKHIRFFKEQNAMMRSPKGDEFRRRVDRMDCVEAFDAAQEPWQMALAVFHSHKPEPENTMFPTSGETTGYAIDRYKASRPARAALVDRWMRGYVSQLTDSWNYRGD